MQNELPMAVVHAFRQPRGSGGVERRRLSVLVEVGKVVTRRSGRKQRLIFADKRQSARLGGRPVRHHHEPLDVRQLRLQLFDQPDELVVDEKRRRPGVIDRVEDLLGGEPDVDRLHDRAHHRDCEEGFEKPVAVPVENADRVAGFDADRGERRSQSVDALPDLSVGEPLRVSIDDFLVPRLQ